jgi:hypothetical protein
VRHAQAKTSCQPRQVASRLRDRRGYAEANMLCQSQQVPSRARDGNRAVPQQRSTRIAMIDTF